jgi:hypothetical protein
MKNISNVCLYRVSPALSTSLYRRPHSCWNPFLYCAPLTGLQIRTKKMDRYILHKQTRYTHLLYYRLGWSSISDVSSSPFTFKKHARTCISRYYEASSCVCVCLLRVFTRATHTHTFILLRGGWRKKRKGFSVGRAGLHGAFAIAHVMRRWGGEEVEWGGVGRAPRDAPVAPDAAPVGERTSITDGRFSIPCCSFLSALFSFRHRQV